MTSHPRTPRKPTFAVTEPGPELTITWNHESDAQFTGRVSPYSAAYVTRKDACEDCRLNYTWHRVNTPAVCYDCAPFRAYAALPWWRRWTIRKPRP